MSTRLLKLASLFAFLLFGALSVRQLSDHDLWFLMLSGREVLDRHYIPRTEFFVYPGFGAPQIYSGLGFGVLLEGVTRLTGYAGVSVLNGIIWGIVIALAVAAGLLRARRIVGNLSAPDVTIALFAATLIYYMWMGRTFIRAEVSLYFSWALLALVFEIARQRRTPMLFWASVPPVAWALAWIHSGGVVLLCIVVIALGSTLRDPLWRGGRYYQAWGACLLAAVCVQVLSPNGVAQLLTLLQHLVDVILQPPNPKADLTAHNHEYQPILSTVGKAALPAYMVGLCATAMLIAMHKRANNSLIEILAALVGAALAFRYLRTLGLLAMVLAVPVIATFVVVAREYLRDHIRGRLASCFLLAGVTIVALRLTALPWGVQLSAPQYFEQSQIIRAAFPDGANVLTDMAGPRIAYQAGPAFKVAHGGHMVLITEQVIAHHTIAMHAKERWAEELDRYSVRAICLPALTVAGAELQLTAAPYQASRSKNWRLAGVFPECMLMLREGEVGRPDAFDNHCQRVQYLTEIHRVTMSEYRESKREPMRRFIERLRREIEAEQAQCVTR